MNDDWTEQAEAEIRRGMYENCATGLMEVVGYDDEKGPTFSLTEAGKREVESMPDREGQDIDVPELSDQDRVLLAATALAALRQRQSGDEDDMRADVATVCALTGIAPHVAIPALRNLEDEGMVE